MRLHSILPWLFTLNVLGCGAGSESASEGLGVGCKPATGRDCTCKNGESSKAVCRPDGSAYSECACGSDSAATTPTATPTTLGSSSDAGVGFSCPVRSIIQKSCATCHGSTPQFGAPLSLAKPADFRAAGVAQRVQARIVDDTKPMPPQPYARLTDTEVQTMKAWLAQGAPDQSCVDTTPPLPVDSARSGPTQPTDPHVKCYSMVSRASSAGAKFTVPTTPDLYQCFSYSPPWGSTKVQLVSAHPIIDNSKVIHHWILYNNTGAVTDGASASCTGAHPDAAQVVGWAPGGEDLTLPGDVGLHVDNGGFTLEVHYNNTSGAGQMDASGAQICVTDQIRENEAAVHWLGTQNLNKLNATGTCTPTATGPVTILSSTPHMHLQGRHLKTVINRKGGETDTLIDKPFDFQTQVSYSTPTTINPGDTLSTTCTYASPTPFGQGTNQEMCYNFVIAYPAGGLAQSFQLLRKNDCTGF
jgi:Copper type II ascorbate-dependent monooxygenase, C-terminal domain/Copper type II ascorbate-dependent monooxygenase, N-terminal domain/Cytochrome C oxidase, cbb3-type, subunit III